VPALGPDMVDWQVVDKIAPPQPELKTESEGEK